MSSEFNTDFGGEDFRKWLDLQVIEISKSADTLVKVHEFISTAEKERVSLRAEIEKHVEKTFSQTLKLKLHQAWTDLPPEVQHGYDTFKKQFDKFKKQIRAKEIENQDI